MMMKGNTTARMIHSQTLRNSLVANINKFFFFLLLRRSKELGKIIERDLFGGGSNNNGSCMREYVGRCVVNLPDSRIVHRDRRDHGSPPRRHPGTVSSIHLRVSSAFCLSQLILHSIALILF